MILAAKTGQLLSFFSDMMSGIQEQLNNIVQGIFGYIAKAFYLIFLGLAKLLDICQILFKKFAGLDVVYMNGEAIEGDIVLSFISSDIVQRVFWTLLILSVVLLFIVTFVAVIKTEFTPLKDKAGNNKGKVIGGALRALVNFFAVPVICILGLFLANGLLASLDAATSGGTNVMMSRQIFLAAAYNSNRARLNYEYFNDDLNGYTSNVVLFSYNDEVEGEEYYYINNNGIYYFTQATGGDYVFELLTSHYIKKTNEITGPFYALNTITVVPEDGINNFGIFLNDTTTGPLSQTAADKIDSAFINDLDVPSGYELTNNSYKFMTLHDIPVVGEGIVSFTTFSIYNTNLVYFYYNLCAFDFLIGYLALIFLGYVFITMIIGLIKRLFELTTLFIISPPIVAMYPLDNGEALKKWRARFIASSISAYSAVVVMNIYLMLLPLFLDMQIIPSSGEGFGSFGAAVVNQIARVIIMIAGALFFKEISGAVAGFIGAEDAMKVGSDNLGKVAAGTAMVAGGMLAAGKLGGKILGGGINAGKGAINFAKDPRKFQDKFKDKAGELLHNVGNKVLGERGEDGKRHVLKQLNSNIKGIAGGITKPFSNIFQAGQVIASGKPGSVKGAFDIMAGTPSKKDGGKGGKSGDKGGKDKGDKEKPEPLPWMDKYKSSENVLKAKQKALKDLKKSPSHKLGLDDLSRSKKEKELKAEISREKYNLGTFKYLQNKGISPDVELKHKNNEGKEVSNYADRYSVEIKQAKDEKKLAAMKKEREEHMEKMKAEVEKQKLEKEAKAAIKKENAQKKSKK